MENKVVKEKKDIQVSKTEVKKVVSKAVPVKEKKEAFSDSDKDTEKSVAKSATAVKAKKGKLSSEVYYGTGKRKCSIAKVWLYKGKGEVIINDLPALSYVGTDILVAELLSPLRKLGFESQYDCKISVLGGGIVGQVGAGLLGISRALLVINPEFRKVLKENGFLTRDSRIKERKKYGRKRARKGFQFRKR